MTNHPKAPRTGTTLTAVLIFALIAVFSVRTVTAQTFNSPEELRQYLDSQPDNSLDKPIKVAVSANDQMIKDIAGVIRSAGKYVSMELTGSALTSIGDGAFFGCTSLTGVTIPDNVTSIGDSAFYRCTSLASVTMPSNVTSIGNYAFYGCTSLVRITIPDSVTSIGELAFWKCTSLTKITLPDSVAILKYATFMNCYSLTSVTFQGTIIADNSLGFRITGPFLGDLWTKYLAEGIGTYTTSNPGENAVWMKQ